jgi:ABC-type phosphonate transport system ATPase subunit
LPFKDQWQRIANELPNGDVLVVVPSGGSRQKTTLETLATRLRAKGHRVTTVLAASLPCAPSDGAR